MSTILEKIHKNEQIKPYKRGVKLRKNDPPGGGRAQFVKRLGPEGEMKQNLTASRHNRRSTNTPVDDNGAK